MADEKWFSVRCLFDQGSRYEERITVWKAASFDAAIGLAEAEAREYADIVDCRYIDLAQAYELPDPPGHGEEVFSLMRDSDLPPSDYIDSFFDTGTERQRS